MFFQIEIILLKLLIINCIKIQNLFRHFFYCTYLRVSCPKSDYVAIFGKKRWFIEIKNLIIVCISEY